MEMTNSYELLMFYKNTYINSFAQKIVNAICFPNNEKKVLGKFKIYKLRTKSIVDEEYISKILEHLHKDENVIYAEIKNKFFIKKDILVLSDGKESFSVPGLRKINRDRKLEQILQIAEETNE